MNDLAPYLVVGLTSGSLYGLAGMGLVLTFKTTGVFNFAHGAIAAVAAYAFYDLHTRHDMAWPLAFGLCVLVLGPILGLAAEVLTRSLGNGRPVTVLTATVGLLLLLQGALDRRYGATQLQFPNFLPTGGITVRGVEVQYLQITIMALGLLSALGLYLFFSRTRSGLTMRAVVDDESLLDIVGVPLRRVRRTAWAIGCTFAAATGILIAPSLGLQSTLLTLLVVQAFGAAALGRFSSLPLTYVGGLAVGVLAALATRLSADHTNLIGLPSSVPFVVLFGVLLVTPRKRFPVEAGTTARARRSRRPRNAAVGRWGTVAVALALVAVPHVVGTRLPVFMSALCLAVVFLSLSLLVKTSGQISICHAAFVAVGATTFAHLTSGAGLPWPVAVAGAFAACLPVGLVVAIPAMRLSGVYLALATFGFGILMQRVVYPLGLMFGSTGFRAAPRPSIGGVELTSDYRFYYVLLGLVVLSASIVLGLERSQLGRFLRALSQSPEALRSHGLHIDVLRVIVFCLSAGIAGVAGAMTVTTVSQVSGQAFDSFTSLLWLATLAICGERLLRSSLIAAALIAVVPSYAPHVFGENQAMIFGAVALLVAIATTGGLPLPRGRVPDRTRSSPVQARSLRVGQGVA